MNINEIYRYMGIKDEDGITPDIEKKVNKLLCVAKQLINYRYAFKKYQISFFGENGIDLGFTKIESKSLKKALSGCSEIYLFIATIGMEFEKKLQAFSLTSPVDALIFQAIGTELLESETDEMLKKEKPCEKFFLQRVSPGYGDIDILMQKDIFKALSPEKGLGVYLLDSMLMIPSKTITFIVGVADRDCEKEVSCKICDKKDCEYRKELLK